MGIVDKFEHVYIDESSRGSELAEKALSLFPADKVEWITEKPLADKYGELSASEFNQSKKLLYLTKFKGHFFKRCPGARPGLTCCNYFVLNLGLQCDMNCSYCYLQDFINTPTLTVYTNIDDALLELEEIGKELKGESFRVGTGEVIDSLSLDEFTLYSRKLIHFFKQYPNWKLEFKTKSNKVDQFIDLAPAKNTYVSWSINPQYIIEKEEHLTASLDERLAAAKKCSQAGFSVSFHIDPMIWHKDWKKNYANLVHRICAQFTPEDVPVLSVGALRFQPNQRHLMRERFGMDSLITSAEMFPGSDGKMRYDLSLRKEMFQFIISEFKKNNSRWNIFMCMETPETWLKSVDQLPTKDDGLKEMFNHRLINKFNNVRNETSKSK